VPDKKNPEEAEGVGYSSSDLMAGIPRQVFDGEGVVTLEAKEEEETPSEKPPEEAGQEKEAATEKEAGQEPPEPPETPRH
jgi:hypothetical protein